MEALAISFPVAWHTFSHFFVPISGSYLFLSPGVCVEYNETFTAPHIRVPLGSRAPQPSAAQHQRGVCLGVGFFCNTPPFYLCTTPR